MPASKKSTKGKGGGGEKKKKKGANAATEKEALVKLCKSLLKSYQQRCASIESTASPKICRELRSAIENEVPMSKFVLEPTQALVVRPFQSSKRSSRGPSAVSSASATSGSTAPKPAAAKAEPEMSSVESKPTPPPILLQPLVNSWMEVKYCHVRCLHVWSMYLEDDAIVSLALLFESALGHNIKVLELRETKVSSWAVSRLARSLKTSQLSTLNLDFNPHLCECLQRVTTLYSLSLNFCQLDSTCGEPLGVLTATSQIKELSLIGNHLECEGINEFLRPLVSVADAHISATAPLIPQDHHSTNEKQSPSQEAPPISSKDAPPPSSAPSHPPMPPIAKLLLQDNCIDIHGECTDMDSVFASVICMRTLKRYIISSPLLEEVNLEGNWIGDGGAREVMLALQQRKEVGLPPIRMSVSRRICPEIFTTITELNASSGTKKKGKGKKGKKKKK